MPNPLERYQKLGFRDSLRVIYRYPIACKELSFILRGVYNKFPKNLQTLIFEDTLMAFNLLPEMQMHSAVSAANLLLQSAEATLPKQKKNLAVKEFKQAKVAHKRRCKARQEEKCSGQLPQDVLLHVFCFLDMQSIVSVGQVCWSWNLAASDNCLWKSQYTIFFGNYNNSSKVNGHHNSRLAENKELNILEDDKVDVTSIDWREAFKRTFTAASSKRLTSNRGYCGLCNSIVWLNNLKCSERHCKLTQETRQIRPVSPSQVVEYLLNDSFSAVSSSDSDSDSDGVPISRLWAYPIGFSRCEK